MFPLEGIHGNNQLTLIHDKNWLLLQLLVIKVKFALKGELTCHLTHFLIHFHDFSPENILIKKPRTKDFEQRFELFLICFCYYSFIWQDDTRGPVCQHKCQLLCYDWGGVQGWWEGEWSVHPASRQIHLWSCQYSFW